MPVFATSRHRRPSRRTGALAGAVAALAVSVAAASAFAGSPERLDRAAAASEPAERLMPPEPEPPSPTANYRVTISIEWDDSTHPATLPPNAHISPPVVAAHGEVGDLFAPGTIASNGIERMAEVGSTNSLVVELATDPTVGSVTVGSSLFGSGQRTFDVTLSVDQPLVSLVTMLAPSPDWFVGVRDVSMLADGAWLDLVTLELGNYDAGTDSGTGFTSPNADTQPAMPIGGPSDAAFAAAVAEGRFGTVAIVRTDRSAG